MRISHESDRVRRLALVAAWLFAALVLTTLAREVRDYLDLAGRLGLRGEAHAHTPLKQIYPAFAPDAQVWVRYSLELLEGHDIRLRHTDIDNALEGREVHWNSAWAWAIAGAGKAYQAMNGGTVEESVEKATIWLPPLTQLLLIVLVSTWISRRAGVVAGLFLVAAMTLHQQILEGFFPSYVDHHGLLTVSVLGVVLGGAMMAGGWWRSADPGAPGVVPSSREAVRSGAILSAMSGALGVWVSAASVIPAVAITGIAGLATTVLFARAARTRGEAFDADAWVIWGRVGAAASFVFYLVEYFPQYLGWRLEVNHPLYALAWLGGGEFVARAGKAWIGEAGPRRNAVRSLVWPTLAIAAAPLTIAVFGATVMTLSDRFMAELHHGIEQFHPLWERLGGGNAQALHEVAVVALPLVASLVTVARLRWNTPMALACTTLSAGALVAMGVWQVRWVLNAGAAEIVLALVLIATWTLRRPPAFRWGVALAIALLLYAPEGTRGLVNVSNAVASRNVTLADAKFAFLRDLAAAIRATQPSGDIVLLSSPNTSTPAGYYGRFRTLGTLYWENGPGLKAAAAIWSARNDADAARLLAEHGVTHIALVRNDDFIGEYYALLNPGATAADFQASFGSRVLSGKSLPPWLHAVAYESPKDLAQFQAVIYRVELPR